MKPTNNARRSRARFCPSKTKGQVEVQFNWIFILIAGAIILGFFVSIAVKQQGVSEQKVSTQFFTQFEAVVTSSSVTQGIAQSFPVPKMDLRYDCTSACDCAAYAGTRINPQSSLFRLNDRIIFSPNRLQGTDLVTLSKEWEFPFRVTNFFYMTSAEAKYLIEQSTQGESLFDELPPPVIEVGQQPRKGLDKDFFTAEDIENNVQLPGITGNYKVKFVFTESTPTIVPSEIQDLDNSDVTAIKIDANTVTFYEKNDGGLFEEKSSSYLFGDATVIGAIFAEDSNAYNCMMERAFISLNFVARTYREKQELYAACTLPQGEISFPDDSKCPSKDKIGFTPISSRCLINYFDAALSNIIDITENNGIRLTNFNFNQPEQPAANLRGATLTLSQQNSNALDESCPHIY